MDWISRVWLGQRLSGNTRGAAARRHPLKSLGFFFLALTVKRKYFHKTLMVCCECGALAWTDVRYRAWIVNYPSPPPMLPNKRVTHIKDQRWLWSIILICASDICCLCSTSMQLESGLSRSRRYAKHNMPTHTRLSWRVLKCLTIKWRRKNVTLRKQKNHNSLISPRANAALTSPSESHWLGHWKFLLHV